MASTQINFDFDDDYAKIEQIKKAIQKEIKPKSKRGRKSIKESEVAARDISVPDDDLLFQKQYYSISEVADMFKESISLIRYWTNEFPVLKPRLNRKGDRFYKPEDVKLLKVIHRLLRERKYTIEGARDFLKNEKSALEKQDLIDELTKLKQFLVELKTNL